MRRLTFLSVALAACGGGGGELSTFRDSSSYAIGVSIGGSVEDVRDSVDLEILIQGLRDATDGRERKLSQSDVDRVMQRFAQEAQTAQLERSMAEGRTNRERGDAYRERNAKREGVTTTSSGMQFEVVRDGNGATPNATDQVTVHYTGTSVDGSEFDSSGDEAATFQANRVIPGWTEALQMMKVGGKYRLVIPPELAYGDQGAEPTIGPNETLVFEVELLGIGN